MREYGKVFSRIWESADFRALSEDGRALVLYLLTCQHGTIAGVFRVPDGYACEDLQWGSERVSKAFRDLESKGFATRCEKTKWVWVCKFLEWNRPENPNQRKAAAKCAAMVPSDCRWWGDFTHVYGDLLGLPKAEHSNPCETLSEPFLNQYQEQEQEQKEIPPIPPKGGEKSSPVSLKTWIETVKAKGETPIPEEDPVFVYAEKIGLPDEFLALAWSEFRERYSQPGAKRYKDWRSVFRKSVQGNWLKLWWHDGESYRLSTAGIQAQRAKEAKAA